MCSGYALAQTIAGVSNPAAVAQQNVIAPGSLVSVFGGSLAGSLAASSSATLSTTLGDVTAVSFNGVAAPLVEVSDSQVTAQVPWGLIPGPASVTIARGGATSSAFSTQVNQFAPAIFSIRVGGMQAIAVNGDGALAAPKGFLGLGAHPATAGDTLTLFATGLGPVNAAPADGALPADTTSTTATMPVVTIGGMPATVSWAGLSTQSFGVYQINVVVPQGVPTGNAVPIQMQIGGANALDTVTIAIQ
jgi:uncharacterized protein (TIGR03437 family)